MSQYRTEQEIFWAGEFGDDYISRNRDNKLLAGRTALFGKILSSTNNISTVLELGSNVGLNLMAIKRLLPEVKLTAVEINRKAVEHVEQWGGQSRS